MDSIKAQKIQAMKNYKKAQFVYNLIVYSLTAFLSIFFYLYMFWFTSMKPFFSIFIPNIYSFILSPKFLFVVGNVIFLFLVGESKVRSSSSPAAEIYYEYVQRSRSLGERSMRIEHKKKERKLAVEMHTSIRKFKSVDAMSCAYNLENEKEKEILEHTNYKNCIEADVVKVVDPVEKEEEEEKLTVLANDDLNRRVEEFIARVNRQRRLEERQVFDRW
ncbi:hypothetical protein ACH5RR_030869 [Cinchona calisaya]|uniref:DUF4408 domain-containing protein n=1 Tax=Cinchona calisaya TaxID=153742 RepID=A0ABD2YVY4_9GENT